MEKLHVHTNGQWKLIKAWGDPDYYQISHGNSPFKDQESENAARQNLMHYLQHNPPPHVQVKNMLNLTTNRTEPHVLMHRGIGAMEASEIMPHGYFIDDSGVKRYDNMLDFSDGSTVKTKTNSIHTFQPDEAKGHAEDWNFGKMISFWVPASSLYGHCAAINHHILNPGEPPLRALRNKDTEFDADHVMIKPGQYRLANDVVSYVEGIPTQKNHVP